MNTTGHTGQGGSEYRDTECVEGGGNLRLSVNGGTTTIGLGGTEGLHAGTSVEEGNPELPPKGGGAWPEHQEDQRMTNVSTLIMGENIVTGLSCMGEGVN